MMYRTAIAGSFALCLICTSVLLSSAEEQKQCSVERSKHARYVLHKYIFPKIDRLHYELPASCPLRPSRDMYLPREQAKVRRPSGNRFVCNLCKERFASEEAWERHYDRKHHVHIDPRRDVCLADYCELLHCDKINLTPVSRQLRAQQAGDPTLAPHAPCRETMAEQLRGSCRALAAVCFPEHGGPAAEKLHRLFMEGVCAAHTCDTELQEDLLEQLAASERGTLGYKLLIGLALGAMGVFYACLWVYYQYQTGFRSRGDVRRLRRKKTNKFLEFFGIHKSKAHRV
ncbi:hypothetical protein WJX75_001778 [Coccomyxa subellipsoidea]|uniref:C2H2-type domain-containing protein n=1 Tax=Coccomyxa subellipsoidea TaxID=248742 RepID=A0ABR2YC06_9CHLO